LKPAQSGDGLSSDSVRDGGMEEWRVSR
jgi:hypothetical protein